MRASSGKRVSFSGFLVIFEPSPAMNSMTWASRPGIVAMVATCRCWMKRSTALTVSNCLLTTESRPMVGMMGR